VGRTSTARRGSQTCWRLVEPGSSTCAGIGRVAASLAVRGHDVTAVEKDPDLVARSRACFPDVSVVESDILGLSAAALQAAGRPTWYDVVVVVGT
jgi:16S rRNA A1518/A1519 N6-dimethyltransferase RsmA/KsgA/DIM1 with predicted DNA glycosylase/AP lyase activity